MAQEEHSATAKRTRHRGVSKRPGAYLTNSTDKGWLLVWNHPLIGKRRTMRLDRSC